MTKYEPLVSVIIPTFNHAQFLSAAIQSVLNQTYNNFEIIVVDDGSKDNTKQIVALFCKQVRYVWQENQGLSAARNTGIRLARGQFIGFLDADDIWLPQFLNKQLSFFETSETGATYCGNRFMNVDGEILPQFQKFAPPPERFRYHLLDGPFFPVHAVLLRMECIQDLGGFDENLRALEDFDMWLRLSRKYNFIGNPQINVLTRVRHNSMSADLELMAVQEQVMIQKHYPAGTIRIESEEAEYIRLLGNASLRTSVSAIYQREWNKAVEFFAQAFITYPDLIHKLSTYYDLIMAELPRGRKSPGELRNLDRVVSNTRNMLTDSLQKLSDKDLTVSRVVYRGLYNAAGQIAYAQDNLVLARSYFLNALGIDKKLALDRQYLRFLSKSLLPSSVFRKFKSIKKKLKGDINVEYGL